MCTLEKRKSLKSIITKLLPQEPRKRKEKKKKKIESQHKRPKSKEESTSQWNSEEGKKSIRQKVGSTKLALEQN